MNGNCARVSKIDDSITIFRLPMFTVHKVLGKRQTRLFQIRGVRTSNYLAKVHPNETVDVFVRPNDTIDVFMDFSTLNAPQFSTPDSSTQVKSVYS
jgi:hypothetical protein